VDATWVGIGIAVIAAAGSIAAAVISSRSASRAKAAELQAARIHELESRLAESKAKVYGPMVRFQGRHGGIGGKTRHGE
jgi:hypothetical protein